MSTDKLFNHIFENLSSKHGESCIDDKKYRILSKTTKFKFNNISISISYGESLLSNFWFCYDEYTKLYLSKKRLKWEVRSEINDRWNLFDLLEYLEKKRII